MAIWMMTDRKNVTAEKLELGQARLDLSGAAKRAIAHHPDCPHYKSPFWEDDRRSDDCDLKCIEGTGFYLLKSYEGCVLGQSERNGYNDSDFYAAVWDEELQCVHSIEWATTRFWSYSNSCNVDATAEVRKKAAYYNFKKAIPYTWGRALKEVQGISRGDLVEVIKGRKIPQGLVGEVFWMQDGRFGVRLGLKVRNPEEFPGYTFDYHKTEEVPIVWVAGSNCEICNPEALMPPLDVIAKRALNEATTYGETLAYSLEEVRQILEEGGITPGVYS